MILRLCSSWHPGLPPEACGSISKCFFCTLTQIMFIFMPHCPSQMQPVSATKEAAYTKLSLGCYNPILPPVPIFPSFTCIRINATTVSIYSGIQPKISFWKSSWACADEEHPQTQWVEQPENTSASRSAKLKPLCINPLTSAQGLLFLVGFFLLF